MYDRLHERDAEFNGSIAACKVSSAAPRGGTVYRRAWRVAGTPGARGSPELSCYIISKGLRTRVSYVMVQWREKCRFPVLEWSRSRLSVSVNNGTKRLFTLAARNRYVCAQALKRQKHFESNLTVVGFFVV